MKVRYLGVLRTEPKDNIAELCGVRDWTGINYFLRSGVDELMMFYVRLAAWKVKPGRPVSIDEDKDDFTYILHVHKTTEGICSIMVTEKQYPERVAHSLLAKICDEFLAKHPKSSFKDITNSSLQQSRSTNPIPMPELETYLKKYQTPEEADNIMKIQKELDETKEVLHMGVNSLLERGEKIGDLVAKSDQLSAQSKMFYTQAKKQNSCCVIM